jgi:uncharacterized protein DUF1588/uncharacterized protein DUF1592/uncharacterized protein DUF1585/uncharacterized protein DUF1595/uncharacterized protein DUF1587
MIGMFSAPMFRGYGRTTATLALVFAVAVGALGCRRKTLVVMADAGGIGGGGGGAGGVMGIGGAGAGAAGAGGAVTHDGGAGSNGGAGTGGGAGSSGGGGTDGGAGAGGSGPSAACGIPGTSQLPRLTNRQYDRTVRDLLGVTAVGAFGGLPPSAVLAPDQPGDITMKAWDGYVAASEAIAAQVMADPILRRRFMACEPTGDGNACLKETIIAFGRRAFRRPLRPDEMARFEKIVSNRAMITATGAATEVGAVLLQTFLVSPSFLQRSEIADAPDGQGRFVLSPYEVASRLSFLLWGSTPDEELDRAADAGTLVIPEQIRAQAKRMVRDARAREVVAAFHRTYLGAAIDAETERLVDVVAFDGNGSFQDLFATTRAFVNRDTAPLYGLAPSGFGPSLQEVTLDANQRPGILTRVGFLSAYAHANRTAPILRGAFISNAILGLDLTAPQGSSGSGPDAGALPTNRARAEAQTAAPVCAACHRTFINPPGFVLEAYDAAGRWQTTEADTGAPIDTAADVFIDGAAVAVRDPADLMARLAASRDAQRTYARRWVAYAYGRDGDPRDACVVEALATDIHQVRLPILDVLVGLTQPESFRVRAREATP